MHIQRLPIQRGVAKHGYIQFTATHESERQDRNDLKSQQVNLLLPINLDVALGTISVCLPLKS